MGLRLTLKPNERVVVNGCVIRNADRRQTLTIETLADVVREADLLDESEAATPVKEVYFLVQSSLLKPEIRDEVMPVIQQKLAKLVAVFHDDVANHIFDAAMQVSMRDYYKAMRALRPVVNYEEELLERIRATSTAAE